MKRTKAQVRITLRLPPDAKAFIEKRAEENFTSENAEIVRCVLRAMKAETATGAGTPAAAE